MQDAQIDRTSTVSILYVMYDARSLSSEVNLSRKPDSDYDP